MVCLGVAAFAVDRLRGDPVSAGDTVISVPPRAQVLASPQTVVGDEIVAGENRDPVERWVRAEVLYREALRLGLDQNDLIVRRRLVQKMEYALDNMAALDAPQRVELEQFFARNAEHYREPAAESFTQVTFSLRDGSEAALERAAFALDRLQGKGRDAGSDYGDPSADGMRIASATDARLAQLYGAEFTNELKHAEVSVWDGPLRSRTGVHLVFRERSEPSRIPELDEVYKRVARDWVEHSRAVAREEHYAELAARYHIVRADEESDPAGSRAELATAAALAAGGEGLSGRAP
jgi:hypothetical protein